MNKEPIGLYIFRFVLGLGMFAFMCLLYWSSLLLEQNNQAIRNDLSQLKNDIFVLRSDLLKTLLERDKEWLKVAQSTGSHQNVEDKKAQTSVPVSDYPNLLEEDKFYEETLPKLLGADFKPHGTRRGATYGKPDNLHPFSNWSETSSWISLCSVTVSKLKFGKYETYAPDMAVRMEERKNSKTGEPEFWIFLRDNVYWQPLKSEFFSSDLHLAPQFLRKNQVTAEDFKFFFDAMMNPYVQEAGAVSLRTYYGDIKEIEVIDKLTFVVRWNTQMASVNGVEAPRVKYIAKQLTGGLKPLASFVYKYFANGKKIIEDDSDPNTYRTNSVWGQNFSQHWAKNVIVSCGPWVFDGKTDRQITFVRNAEYYMPYEALAERMEVEFKDSPEAVWLDFKANRLDTYAIPPDELLEFSDFLQTPAYKNQAAKGFAIERLDYVARSYNYIGWNQAKPFFTSAKVRQALTMAIDRQRIIQQNLNGMGIEINGPFYRFSPNYNLAILPWPYDLQKSKHLLEEEGWFDSTGDGIIDKKIDGKTVKFKFGLTYYVKNPTTRAICEYVSTALKEIGIECNLVGVDIADLSAAFEDKSFDALFLGWALGTPPEDPRQLWYSKGAKEKGSSNAVGFANEEADKIIRALDFEYNPDRRLALYHRFGEIIHEQQPYTFLFTPKTALIYREYLQNVFLPKDRQDLIPGANIAEPDPSIFWIKPH